MKSLIYRLKRASRFFEIRLGKPLAGSLFSASLKFSPGLRVRAQARSTSNLFPLCDGRSTFGHLEGFFSGVLPFVLDLKMKRI